MADPHRARFRSLRSKIVRSLLLVVVVYAALDHTAQRQLLLPRFQALQEEQARIDLRRAAEDLDAAVAELDRRCAALAGLRIAERYLSGASSEFAELVLEDDFLAAQAVDLAFVVARDGSVRWSALSDAVLGEEGALVDFPRGALSPNHPLTRRRRGEPLGVSGLFPSTRGPMLACAEPIGDAGWLILGSLLAGETLRAIDGGASLGTSAWTLDSPDIPAEARDLLDRVTAAPAPVTADTPRDTLAAYAVLEDLQNRPTILLRTETDRSILDSAYATLHYALLSAIAIGLAMLLVLQRLLGRAVITPLAQLTHTALKIGASDDDTARIDLDRDDEIGVLASEFDAMLRKLASSRQALVSAARTAGMSEIATGILHNIGNVLNSVVLSRELVAETLDQSQITQLRRLLELLEGQDDLARFLTEDPRGTKFVPFLEALTLALEEERQRARDELAGLGEGVEHIRELVASQQALAGRSTVVERVSVADQVARAIEVTASANGSDARLVVEREIPELPAQLLDRHKLLEILVNLVQNARQAVSEAEVEDPRIAVRVATEGDVLTIRVTDNGRGIAPEHLEQIFAHGFTTRRNGHGFGLHASANSARELGGALTVHSDGPGRGAEFTLTLPFDDGSRTARAA